ncbi:MAG TPA: APC family permease [Terriglobales bacterium]|nr:APC family permease [Terriglobales bacterium]
MQSAKSAPAAPAERLPRALGLRSAVALNMINMIGVGPFITIPLILQAMGGPQAMLGWLLGAGFALCDGLIWAELGAALPGEGGSYHYLSEIYGPQKWGRLFSFLFIWQNIFSAPLTIASGCIGLALYATYLWPSLDHPLLRLNAHLAVSRATLVAMGCCLLALFLAYRQIRWIGRLSQWLWGGVLFTMAWVIFAGVTHFHAARALSFPPGAFRLGSGFFLGLGSAMLIAFYDYEGYENANYLADEVVRPERTLPRAILISIALVGLLYLVMNVSVLGVVPWREMLGGAGQGHVISLMMQRVYGVGAARVVTGLILWTAFASVFGLLVSCSRILYAAAADGNFFRSFARLHPRHRFPSVALLVLGLVATAFCVFRLDEVIAALVVIRVLLQYLLQAVGLLLLRRRRPELARPFRMWLYPLPVLAAIAGFLFLLLAPVGALRELALGGVVVAAGVGMFLLRARRDQSWPFAASA